MLTKKKRSIVFAKYNGRCAYCGCELQKGWHVDHLKPVRKMKGKADNPENDVLENMNPACPSCNINKHSMTLEDFRRSISGFVESLNKRSVQYQIAKKYGLIEETGKPVIFYFEKTDKQ